MVKPMNFETLDKSVTLEGNESARRRWTSRDADPSIQMSVRMQASVYDTFKKLCKRERRTNGDMLEVLMKSYLSDE